MGACIAGKRCQSIPAGKSAYIDEWAVLKLDLTFPHLFTGIMDKYYRQREKDWTESNYLSRLKEMIAIERSLEEVLNNYDAIIKKITQ
jgi:spore coat-associated protein S